MNTPISFALGEENYRIANYEKAYEYYLISADNGYSPAFNKLGLTCMKLKRFDQAEKYFQIAIDKNITIALYNLACLYKERHIPENAKKYYLMYIKQYKSDDANNINIDDVINELFKLYTIDEKMKIFAAL